MFYGKEVYISISTSSEACLSHIAQSNYWTQNRGWRNENIAGENLVCFFSNKKQKKKKPYFDLNALRLIPLSEEETESLS